MTNIVSYAGQEVTFSPASIIVPLILLLVDAVLFAILLNRLWITLKLIYVCIRAGLMKWR